MLLTSRDRKLRIFNEDLKYEDIHPVNIPSSNLSAY